MSSQNEQKKDAVVSAAVAQALHAATNPAAPSLVTMQQVDSLTRKTGCKHYF